MDSSELTPAPLFHLGPIEVTPTVLYSIIASALVIAIACLVRLGLGRRTSGWPVAAELLVEHFEELMRDMFDCDPRPYTPLIVTLALFIAVANLIGLVPGLHAPTADFSTTAALAVVVFFAVPFYGIRARGVRGYLGHYLEPSPLLLPDRDHHRILPHARACRSTVRQRHERGVDHRRPAFARRSAGPRSDHDARRIDERVAGLHLRGPDGRLLERGRANPQTERGSRSDEHAIDLLNCLHGGGRGDDRRWVRSARPSARGGPSTRHSTQSHASPMPPTESAARC